jgi:hypothetical protein
VRIGFYLIFPFSSKSWRPSPPTCQRNPTIQRLPTSARSRYLLGAEKQRKVRTLLGSARVAHDLLDVETYPESHLDQFLKDAHEHISVLTAYLLDLYKPK